MSAAAVEAIDVTKSFHDVQAVKGVSLSVGEGQFFSLLGPSGCGKTTLLRMIAGFETPSTGAVYVGGKDMSGVPPHRRPVNMVFQSYALFPHLTVFDNVAFGMRVGKNRVPKAEIGDRVKEALSLVQLPHVAERYPRELSGGQQQRIAFARAIVNKPFVLLLDEPLSALDPRIRDEMQAELARFKKQLGITFIMVTHDQSEAFALSDQVAVFNAGRLEQVGSPQEIYEQPKSAFVADFIGQTNVLPGKVLESSANTLKVRLSDHVEVVAEARQDENFNAGDSCVVWIRTDDIAIASADAPTVADSINTISGTILHRSYQGYTREYFIEASGLKLIALIEEDIDENWQSGERVQVRIPYRLTNALRS